jgi:cyclase
LLQLTGAMALLLSAAPAEVPRIENLRGDAAVLVGSSCNVVVLRGKDGLLLVDDQRSTDYAETRDLLTTTYRLPVTKIVNTHWHLDHAGGNALFAFAGAQIIAQRNVRARLTEPQYMTAYQKLIPASPPAAWPVRVFTSNMTFGFGSEVVRLVHVAHAHTDGDTIVRIEHANVIHMGDIYFGGMFPFIDLSSGGSIQGTLRAVDIALGMSDEETRIVPGHGPVASRRDLLVYRAMLADVSDHVRAQVRRGRSLAEVLSTHPAGEYRLEGDADRFVAAVYAGWSEPGPHTER